MTSTPTIPSTSTPATSPPTLDPVAVSTVRRLGRALLNEYVKLTTVRAYWAIAALTVTVGTLVTWGVARYVDDEPMTVATLFLFASVFTAVFAAVAGILLFSTDAQHGSLGPTLSAQPRRWVVATAKATITAVFGAALGLVGVASGLLGGVLGGIPAGDTSTILESSLWAVAFTTLSALLGLGVGMIARHSTAAISGLLVWWLVVENLLAVFLDPQLSRFLPFAAGNGLLQIVIDDPDALAVALSLPQNAAVFGGYALLALVVGTALLHLRDAH
ncbi:hypothetical protein [Euzebya pacifica]|jgi:hypothetical protein|uniref:hypothetical protein n=1 Tax=Euzebya pacifica TaxID=1608957 RepID=UPI0030F8BA66